MGKFENPDFNFDFGLERPDWLKEIYALVKQQYELLKKSYFADVKPLTWKDFISPKIIGVFRLIFRVVTSVELLANLIIDKCIELGDTNLDGKLSSQEKLDLAAKLVDDLIKTPVWMELWDRQYIIKPCISLVVTAINIFIGKIWVPKFTAQSVSDNRFIALLSNADFIIS